MLQDNSKLESAGRRYDQEDHKIHSMSTTSKTNQTSSKPTSVQKTIRPNSTSGLVISAKSATVTLSSQASSSSSSNDSSAAHSDYKSVLDIVQEYTEGRTLIDDKRVNTTKDLSLKDEPLGGGGRIVWKHRQKTRILPRSKRLPVTNVVEELFDSDLMDAIEWTTAESRRPKISEDPAVTSLSNIQAELKEQMLLIHMLPEKFGQIVVRSSDVFGFTVISDSDEDIDWDW